MTPFYPLVRWVNDKTIIVIVAVVVVKTKQFQRVNHFNMFTFALISFNSQIISMVMSNTCLIYLRTLVDINTWHWVFWSLPMWQHLHWRVASQVATANNNKAEEIISKNWVVFVWLWWGLVTRALWLQDTLFHSKQWTRTNWFKYNRFTWFPNWFSLHRLLCRQETSLKYQLSQVFTWAAHLNALRS